MTVAGRRPDIAGGRDGEPPVAASGGDLTALRNVYDRHASLAYGLAMRLTGGDPERAGTVVESAFLRLWRTPAGIGDPGSVRSRIIVLVTSEALILDARSAGPAVGRERGDRHR